MLNEQNFLAVLVLGLYKEVANMTSVFCHRNEKYRAAVNEMGMLGHAGLEGKIKDGIWETEYGSQADMYKVCEPVQSGDFFSVPYPGMELLICRWCLKYATVKYVKERNKESLYA